MQSLGCVVQHCAPETHYLIGRKEKRHSRYFAGGGDRFWADPTVLASSPQDAELEEQHAGIKPELVRCKALRAIPSSSSAFEKDSKHQSSWPTTRPEGSDVEMDEERTEEKRSLGHWQAVVMGPFTHWEASMGEIWCNYRSYHSWKLWTASRLEQWKPDREGIQTLCDSAANLAAEMRGGHCLQNEKHIWSMMTSVFMMAFHH